MINDLKSTTRKLTGAWRDNGRGFADSLVHGSDTETGTDRRAAHVVNTGVDRPEALGPRRPDVPAHPHRGRADPDPGTDHRTPRHDPDRARRESMFFEADPERRAAARAEWLADLRRLVARGDYRQADREFERVLGLPEYTLYGAPKNGRPPEQFTDGSLISKVSGSFGGRDDVYPPQPSSLRHLTWSERVLRLSPDDVLLDIGSGTGTAIDFFGMFTEAKKVYGMEIEPDYAAFADRRAADLGLNHVHSLHKDILEEPLPDDVTAVYLFNPLGSTGDNDAVGTVADKLVDMGASRPLKVVVMGPDMASRLEASGAFTLESEKDFSYLIQGRPASSSWKFFTSGRAAGA
ncbi:methyltransferase domain-containing protein [Nocardia testacea]|uniref:methyltransferase domain-containing protein n=1 Tax=Nocardia testacea TaxID=248551 RepID=UPI0012F66E48